MHSRRPSSAQTLAMLFSIIWTTTGWALSYMKKWKAVLDGLDCKKGMLSGAKMYRELERKYEGALIFAKIANYPEEQ